MGSGVIQAKKPPLLSQFFIVIDRFQQLFF
nr:MAG TPA: hypothetical protein [Caudoviricetes sp.]